MPSWQVLACLFLLISTFRATMNTDPATSASTLTGRSSADTGTESMKAYPSRNGKCIGDLRSWVVRKLRANTTVKLIAAPTKALPHHTDAYAPRPISRVKTTSPPRFSIGRTERSWPSIMRASTTTITPVREFS